jgi:hypothetical protein
VAISLAKKRSAYALQPVVNSVGSATVIAVAVALYAKGHGFYFLSLDARVDHPLFTTLRPSGFVGHGYGIVGTGIILTNLLYLVRRKLPNLPLGSMRAWLDMHVFTGLLGSELVLFHSAFQLRNAVATSSAASLSIVVVTGIVGRFLFALSPKPDAAGVENALRDLDARVPGLGGQMRAALESSRPHEPEESTLLGWVAHLPRWWKTARMRRRQVLLVVATSPAMMKLQANEKREATKLGRAVARAGGREVRAMAAAGFLRSWRSLHRFFAILMVLAVVVHVGVAWYFGYRWIFES